MLELLKSYKTPVVRDLVWAILSPPLVSLQDSQADWPDADWYAASYACVEDKLRQLDEEPSWLENKINQQNATRLGFYFETLIAAWLELEEATTVLATNPQVSRGDGSTQGAFDFLTAVNDQQEHWECAVKFYLGQSHDLHSLWYGPNRKDRLDKKLRHMENTQLALSTSDAGIAWLSEAGYSISKQRAIVKGYVFYPASNLELSPPLHATESHLRSRWMTWEQFEQYSDASQTWHHLPRLTWLAPRKLEELGKLATLAEERDTERAMLLSQYGHNGWELERLFVVPNNWEQINP